ncbi:phage tail tape measure protein [Streptomyces sp. NPDC056500]|uniref:phage tail tape measure protein n=1 Tax=Streptomyces sp. NPDC056500 TaxID=3345840 RepID=UPI0036D16E43
MALTIGELTGFIRIDDGQVQPGLRRAESAVEASGRAIAQAAGEAGEAAGDSLGDGIVRGADGRLRNARGHFVAAGRRAGDAVGDGLERGVEEGAEDAVQGAEGELSRMQMVAAGAGVAAGAALMVGIAETLSQDQITAKLGAQLGTTPAVAQRYGKIAGKMFGDAVTGDFQTAADAIKSVVGSGLAPPNATNRQLESIATKAADVSSTFNQELGGVTNAVSQLMRTGLAKNATEAFDIVTKGLGTSANKADDFLETLNEYSTQFRRVGLDGATATGLLTQALANGAKDGDQVADALGIFGETALAGGTAVDEAFKSIGLNSGVMAKDIGKGGASAQSALQKTMDALRGTKDEQVKLNAAGALFGDPGKIMGDALFKLDPASAAASSGMDKAKGSTDALAASLRNNASTQVTKFQNGMKQGFVNILGGQVIPAMISFGRWARENSTSLTVLASVIGGALVVAMTFMGITATRTAIANTAAWFTSGTTAGASAARQVAAAASVVGGWIAQGAAAVAQGARVVGAWILMGAQALIQGARMAAAWVLAMGPVGWIIAAVVGLAALIFLNWDKIKEYTAKAWDWVWNKIKSFASFVWNLFLNWTIYGLIIKHWDKIQKGIVEKTVAIIAWVKGVPDRINRALGSLSSLLYGKGKDIVAGLWDGIRGMGSWISGKIIGWAREVIPGPIAKALGIKSPSRVTAAQGRWIVRGLIDGMTGSTKQVKAAAAKLAGIVRQGLAGGREKRALGRVTKDSRRLMGLASQDEKLAAKLKAAQQQLSNQLAARDKLSADVKKGILDGANITAGGGEERVTANSILHGLTSRLKAAQKFAAHLRELRKKGVRGDLIGQIANAGVEQGGAAAAALATASQSQIKAINGTQSALVTAAGQTGTAAGQAMYGAGIQAAQGLVKGLKDRRSDIEREMIAIARGMSKAIRQALGIKSPSRIMAAIGAYIPAGLVRGIESGRGAVDSSMSTLVDPAVSVPNLRGPRPDGVGGRGQQTVVIEIRSSGSRADDFVLDSLRRSVKTRGNDVQLVVAGRRQ